MCFVHLLGTLKVLSEFQPLSYGCSLMLTLFVCFWGDFLIVKLKANCITSEHS